MGFLNDFRSIWGAKLGHVGDIFGRNWHVRIEPDKFRVLFAAQDRPKRLPDRIFIDFGSILDRF